MRSAEIIAVFATGLFCAQAIAMPPSPTSPPANLAGYVTAAQLAAVQASIPAAYTDAKAQAAALTVMPTPCGTPASDTLLGTAGTGTPCTTRPDAARPTAVQRGNATTDSSGNIAVTFGRATVSTSPSVNVIPQKATPAALPITCNTVTRTSTGFTANCQQAQSVVVGALGATVAPFISAASGISVSWVAGEPTQ